MEEAFAGKAAQIRVPTSVTCDACGGSGAQKGSSPITCSTCQGRGRVRAQQGFFTIERTCPTCQGAGRIIEDPCDVCSGAGRVHREKTLQVNVPAGVDDGTRIRLAGEGEAGLRGGPTGDLYIFISVAAHPLFKRDGSNIYCKVPIPMTTASLGGSVEVPVIDGGKARVTVPPGAQTGQRFRLKHKGMCGLRGSSRGDMYVEMEVETPVNLTRRQKDLLREFESEGKGRATSPQSEGFFSKVREFWDDLTVFSGFGVGFIFHIFVGEAQDREQLFVATIGAIALASGMAHALGMSPLFVNLIAGTTVANFSPVAERLGEATDRLRRPFIALLLLIAGASWTPIGTLMWLFPVGFIVMRGAALRFGVRLAVRNDANIDRQTPKLGSIMLSHGALAAAIAVDYGAMAVHPLTDVVVTCLLLSAVANEIWSGRAIRRVLQNAGETLRRDPDDLEDEGADAHDDAGVAHAEAAH